MSSPGRHVHESPARTSDAISSALMGVRILIVEDEFLVALQLEDDLKALGGETVGTYGDLASATDAARREEFDVAVLDINLNGRLVYPLADELAARGVPFIFVSGYSMTNLPERFRAAPRIAKPYSVAALVSEVRSAVGR
jgi:CheY-like chemotaxis protein